MPALRTALEWIADNDDPAELDPEAVAGTVSLLLVADLWSKPADELARKVVRLRRKSLREAKGYTGPARRLGSKAIGKLLTEGK